jgi:hypothetical protein
MRMEKIRIAAALVILCASCATRTENVVAPDPLESPIAAEAQISLPRPPRLAEGEPCLGVLAQVRPDPDSDEMPYWGCFPSGAVDQAYTPGVVESVALEGPSPPSSAVTFDSGALEEMRSKDREALDRSDVEDGPRDRSSSARAE